RTAPLSATVPSGRSTARVEGGRQYMAPTLARRPEAAVLGGAAIKRVRKSSAAAARAAQLVRRRSCTKMRPSDDAARVVPMCPALEVMMLRSSSFSSVVVPVALALALAGCPGDNG